MAPLSLVLTVLAICSCFTGGQTAHSPRADGSGVCKSINECPILRGILDKRDKTDRDVEILKNAQCDSRGEMVRCPNPCFTPEGQPGSCVSIFNCPGLSKLLRPPASSDNIRYVSKYKCGTEIHSVCCATENTVLVAAPGECEATVSAFPPDPRTKCCGVDSNVGNKIVGGSATTVEQYPWLVLIEYLRQGNIIPACGGSLISGRYVLTAAHCVIGSILIKTGTPTNVRLGEYDTNNDGNDCTTVEAGGTSCTTGITRIEIKQIIPHPDYTSRQHSPNDIALVRLKEVAPFTDFIRPICLPSLDVTASPPANFTLFTAGWGRWGNEETQAISNLKRYVALPYARHAHCETGYATRGKNVNLTPKQICAGGVVGKDSCRGDSGGPLMYENINTYEVVGVVSFGPEPCGLPDVPGVYTKVFEYLGWINNNIV